MARTVRSGRRVFEPLPHAESWVCNQASLRRYAEPLVELIRALRHDLARRSRSGRAR
ncbi:MAG: hypothetical protein JO161_07690 [Planctomycetaceae bacterium]|nr:hypothetical protein [Planctomycetaceae bacterium]